MDKTTVPATALEMGNNEATVQHYTKLWNEKHSTYDRDGGASHPSTEGCKARKRCGVRNLRPLFLTMKT